MIALRDDMSDRQRRNVRAREHFDVATCIRTIAECPECSEHFGLVRRT